MLRTQLKENVARTSVTSSLSKTYSVAVRVEVIVINSLNFGTISSFEHEDYLKWRK